jgi:hypothetical protein
MPKKSKNIGISLFTREIHGKASLDNPGYWKKRLEVDFGIQTENDENVTTSYQLYQHYNEYYEFIKSAIEELPALRPRDIRDFLCDKNIGQGKLQINLLKLMLTKPGAKQACAYQDHRGSSALEVALSKDNTKVFEIIKNQLSVEQREAFMPSLRRGNLVSELDSSVMEKYQSEFRVISTIQDNETAFPFYFLSKNIHFDSDSPFIQEYQNNKDNCYFTICLCIDNYLKKQELDPSTRLGI